MHSINFDSGNFKEYAINGDENNTIRINVSDLGFVDRFRTAMSEIEAAQKDYENIDAPSEDILSEIDSRAREIVNKAFNADVCSKAFGNTNCFSNASNGEPVLINFLKAFIPIIQSDFGAALKAQQSAEQIKLAEKTDKYIKPAMTMQTTAPQYAGTISQPNLDVSALTQEQKNALLRELLK